ncbi:MAG: thioesterase family protein [Sinimarinibacterium sp.]
MIFTEAVDTVRPGVRPGNGGWQADIGEDWLQGRTAFGGLQTALAIRALRQQVPDGLPLRVAQTTFMAPVPAGPVRLDARILRTGKSAVHGECRIAAGDQTLCMVMAIFGSSRTSGLRLSPAPADIPDNGDPKREFRYVQGISPSFAQHFVMRWSRGDRLFSGSTQTFTSIHVRHRDPQPLDETHVIALADTVPSPGLSMLSKPAMASSLTWTLELLDHRFDYPHDAFWRMDTEVTAGGDGYLAQSAHLWNPDGRLAALSRQSVVVFG